MVLMGAMAKDFSQAVSEGVGWSGTPQGSYLLHVLMFGHHGAPSSSDLHHQMPLVFWHRQFGLTSLSCSAGVRL